MIGARQGLCILAGIRIDTLDSIGFLVISVIKIDIFLDINDYVLIYYSGHGEKRGRNEIYWIPVNASKNSKRDWVNVDDITVDFEGDAP